MLLDEIAFMFRSQVVTPVAGELKLATIADSLLEDFDTLGVGQSDEIRLHCAFKASDERLVNHLIEEGEVILAVVECPTDAILDEVLFKIHQFLLVEEGHFRLNHPELCQMTGRVAVLGTEGRTESIDGSEGCSSQLAF